MHLAKVMFKTYEDKNLLRIEFLLVQVSRIDLRYKRLAKKMKVYHRLPLSVQRHSKHPHDCLHPCHQINYLENPRIHHLDFEATIHSKQVKSYPSYQINNKHNIKSTSIHLGQFVFKAFPLFHIDSGKSLHFLRSSHK